MRNNAKDRKLELYTLRHFYNGKQYFRIHCTCSAPTKTNICLMRIKTVEPIVIMIVGNIRSCACIVRQMLSHSLRRLSHTWLIFSCCRLRSKEPSSLSLPVSLPPFGFCGNAPNKFECD